MKDLNVVRTVEVLLPWVCVFSALLGAAVLSSILCVVERKPDKWKLSVLLLLIVNLLATVTVWSWGKL